MTNVLQLQLPYHSRDGFKIIGYYYWVSVYLMNIIKKIIIFKKYKI